MTDASSAHARAVESDLAAILDEAEEKIAELRGELARQQDLAAQHEQVDHLDEHLVTATVSWGEVRRFFDDVIAGLRRARSTDGGSNGG